MKKSPFYPKLLLIVLSITSAEKQTKTGAADLALEPRTLVLPGVHCVYQAD